MEHETVGVATLGLAFAAQAPLHGEDEFDAAGAAANHGNRHGSRPRAHAIEQREPAVVELLDGLHGDRVRRGPRDALHLRRGADVDGAHVVGHRRTVPAQHEPPRPVEARDLVAEEAGPGEHRQPRQVDVHVVEAVVPGDVARQHSGVRRVGRRADHGEAHAWLGPHAEAPQHAHVAVPAADEHDVPEDGARSAAHAHQPASSRCSAA